MADKKENVTLKDQLDKFRAVSKLSTEELYGTTETFSDENKRDLDDIKNTIDGIMIKYKKNTGEDIIEFFNAVDLNKASSRNSSARKAANAKKQLMDIEEAVNHADLYSMNEIFSQESGRFQLYSSYSLIYENIPQMAQALDTYVDNIMSPDDFTSDTFNIYLNDKLLNTAENAKDNAKIIKNCKDLVEKYNLDSHTQQIVTDTLKLGDQFVAVLKLDDEISKVMLSEDVNVHDKFIQKYSDKTLAENEIEISDGELQQLSEMFDLGNTVIPEVPDAKKYSSTNPTENAKLTEAYDEALKVYNEAVNSHNNVKSILQKNIAEILNNNFVFSEDASCLLEDTVEISKQFGGFPSKKELFNNVKFDSKDHRNINPLSATKSDKGIHVGGSVLKILKPERTVKLELDDFEYGYYYAENLENSIDMLTTGSYSMSSNIFTSFKTQQNDKADIVNAKYRLITDVFVKNISKKIDKKFINKYPEFKNMIYELLKQNYFLNKQVRITYLRPDQVVHFGIGSEEYHDSLFKSILFSAKLYLAVLTSQVMLRLVRSPEKRI